MGYGSGEISEAKQKPIEEAICIEGFVNEYANEQIRTPRMGDGSGETSEAAQCPCNSFWRDSVLIPVVRKS
ncbi:hypothetical protein PHJA_001208000 [Phtheirospermum japonicum]|uniref:Uncharacterized protein n=1 Tax=Phtheirospermum japonicum TaxID=374723 RepID=A0A830BWD7_9LAMI|nr:hypothetical protein PHJA_001208000 [Phtheirospermum japonicum]